MRITRQDGADGVVCLTLSGELDLATVEVLHEQVDRVLAEVVPDRLVLDAAGLTFCDSTGIGALLQARRQSEALGVAFQLRGPRGITRTSLAVTGVLELLTGVGPG